MELKGKYNTAKIFTENVESACLDQIRTLLDCEAFEGSKIRIQPDCHAGAGCVVGYTQTIEDKVVPNLVGVDISCGLAYTEIPEVDLRTLDKVIQQHIPSGMEIHKPGKLPSQLTRKVEDLLNSLSFRKKIPDKQFARAINSIGTLGGGNHFCELDKSKETGKLYLVVHSGSRNIGLQTCKNWQDIAIRAMKRKNDVSELIKELKEQGRESEIEEKVKEFKKHQNDLYVPKELSYLTGEDMEGYLHDVSVMAKYADLNRRTMLEIILGKLGVFSKKTKISTTCHNYIDLDRKIIRKGAISANADEEVIIPMNMRDGSLLCVGKGNPDWNFSAPHGAGRLMSRGQAKRELSMEAFRESMNGIYTSTVNESTLDEAPMAYKPASEIESLIGDTVEVREHWIPVYNFKAAETSDSWSKKKK